MKKPCKKPFIKEAAMISLVVLILSGCVDQRPSFFTDSENIAENILQSLNNNDYQGFIKDFSEEMKNEYTLQVFTDTKEFLDSKIGAYISKEIHSAKRDEGYIVVFYSAQFENEDNVIVKVVFKEDDETHKVYGLWFDSPKLRE